VFDGSMPKVPRVEPQSAKQSPTNEGDKQIFNNRKSTSQSRETIDTSNSNSGFGDTIVLSAKSPLITISEDFKDILDAN